MSRAPANSLVIPVYKNESGIAALLVAVRDLDRRLGGDLEVVFVVDGSPDRCWELLRESLADSDFDAQLILLSRNFGSFAAIRRGLELATGKYLAVMAADLQEPIELVEDFFRVLSGGESDVVLGVRAGRHDAWPTRACSAMFWAFYRRWVMREMPVGGVDIFGCTARVRDDLLALRESNTSLISQLLWVGGCRKEIPYRRLARRHGRSAWTLARKFRYMLDSVLAFSDLPIFLLLWVGGAGIFISACVAIVVLVFWLSGGIQVRGYTPVMLLISFVGSMLIFGQGIIGSYVWRANENSKRRPLSLVRSHDHFSGRDEPTGGVTRSARDELSAYKE